MSASNKVSSEFSELAAGFNTLPGTRQSGVNPGSTYFKNKKIRRILGIDPGLASTGWGIVDSFENRYRYVAHGVVETKSGTDHGLRLLTIYNRILAVIREYNPTEAGMETLYFAKNVTSALSVAEARGVITLCLAQNSIPLGEFSPLTIKQSITGIAKAEKHQVQEGVKLLLGLAQIPKPDHAADALAAAITRIHGFLPK